MTRNILCTAFIITSFSFGCQNSSPDCENAAKSIKTTDLESYVKEPGSYRFMGRAPFTEGEKITVNYLADQLNNMGFEPAFDGRAGYAYTVPKKSSVSPNFYIQSADSNTSRCRFTGGSQLNRLSGFSKRKVWTFRSSGRIIFHLPGREFPLFLQGEILTAGNSAKNGRLRWRKIIFRTGITDPSFRAILK